MNELSHYTQLKEKVEKARQRADKAQGALEEIMARLKKEFGCDSLPSAKKKLKELEAELVVAKKKFEQAMDNFENEWEEDEPN